MCMVQKHKFQEPFDLRKITNKTDDSNPKNHKEVLNKSVGANLSGVGMFPKVTGTATLASNTNKINNKTMDQGPIIMKSIRKSLLNSDKSGINLISSFIAKGDSNYPPNKNITILNSDKKRNSTLIQNKSATIQDLKKLSKMGEELICKFEKS